MLKIKKFNMIKFVKQLFAVAMIIIFGWNVVSATDISPNLPFVSQLTVITMTWHDSAGIMLLIVTFTLIFSIISTLITYFRDKDLNLKKGEHEIVFFSQLAIKTILYVAWYFFNIQQPIFLMMYILSAIIESYVYSKIINRKDVKYFKLVLVTDLLAYICMIAVALLVGYIFYIF